MSNKLVLKAPDISRTDIDAIAANLIGSWRNVSHPAITALQAIEITRFHKMVIKPTYGVEIVEDLNLGPSREGVPRLGTFDILKNIAIIAIPKDDPRWTWTVWHEVVGHGVLHGPYFRAVFENTLTEQFIDVTEISIKPTAVNELERQANLLAAAVSAPREFVSHRIKTVFGFKDAGDRICYNGPNSYKLEVNGFMEEFIVTEFHQLCRVVAKQIRPFFGRLSAESLAYRVAESGLVIDQTYRNASARRKLLSKSNLELDRVAV